MIIRGSVDEVTAEYASGWAFSPGTKEHLVVQAMLHTEVIGEAVADNYRPDLENVGIGDGICGFNVSFRRPIDSAYLPFVTVRLDGSDVEFPRWHPLGITEFFGALYRGYPASGRHYSVFGGLWTDRVNAAAILRGKLAIKQIGQEQAPEVAALIQDGIALVGNSGKLPPTTSVSVKLLTLLFSPRLVDLLQAVLEDRAVVLQADIVSAGQPLAQVSTHTEMSGQTEAVLVVAPLGTGVVQVDAVRGSHKAPEFDQNGRSRWVDPGAAVAAVEAVSRHGLLDSYAVANGSAAVVGPGLMVAVHCGSDTSALRLVVVPARGVPGHMASNASRKEVAISEAVRAWL